MGLTAVEKDWLRVLCGTRPSNAAIVPADRTLFRARGVRTEDDTHLSQVDWPASEDTYNGKPVLEFTVRRYMAPGKNPTVKETSKKRPSRRDWHRSRQFVQTTSAILHRNLGPRPMPPDAP